MPKCPECQAEIPEGASACAECGAEIDPQTLTGTEEGNPWSKRSEIGWFKGFIDTVKAVTVNPTTFFASLQKNGDWGGALIFGVIVCWIGKAFETLWGLLAFSLIPWGVIDEPALQFLPVAAITGISIISLIIAPVFILIGIFILAGLLHLAALILGDGEKGFEVTLKTVCYASVSRLAIILPFCGGILAFVWGLILLMVGMVQGHRTDTWKGVLAPLLILAFFACCIGMFIFFILGAAAASS